MSLALPSFRLATSSAGVSDLHDAMATAEALWPSLASLEAVYPAFRSWYFEKVLPGIAMGTRELIVEGPPEDPRGVAIVKREIEEAKICTVWVAEDQRETGLGRELLEQAIDISGEALPLFTVPAERNDAFKSLIRRFGFVETARITSLYRPGIVEHIYNGVIRPKFQS